LVILLFADERRVSGEEGVRASTEYSRIAGVMKSRCNGKTTKQHWVSEEDTKMGLPSGHDLVTCFDKGGTTVSLEVYKDKSAKFRLRHIEFDYFQEYKKRPFATLSEAILAFTGPLLISPDALAPSLAELENAIHNLKPPAPGSENEADSQDIQAALGNITVNAYLNDGYQEDGYAHGVWLYRVEIHGDQENVSVNQGDDHEEETDVGAPPLVPEIHRKVGQFTHLGLSEKGFTAKVHARPNVAGPIPPEEDGIPLTQLHWGPTYGFGNSALKTALASGMVDAWFHKGRLINYKTYLGGYYSYTPTKISKIKRLKDVADWIEESPTPVGDCFEEVQGFRITKYRWKYSDVILEVCAVTEFPEVVFDSKISQKVQRQVKVRFSKEIRVLWMGVESADWKTASGRRK